jgi:type IV secretion system protein VirB4
MRHYTRQGAMGTLLDARSDGLSLSAFTVFEIEELMTFGEENVLPVLLYLFHRVERSLKGQPAMLILDEAWIMLGHKVFRAKIREWLKMLRKANCAVVLATQQLTDAINSGIMDVLMDSCPTKIYLPNHEIMANETIRDIYLRQGLNERELDLLSRAVPKRDYYLKSPEGSRMVDLHLGPETLAIIGNSDKESLALVRELERSNPEGWRNEWLALKTGREISEVI